MKHSPRFMVESTQPLSISPTLFNHFLAVTTLIMIWLILSPAFAQQATESADPNISEYRWRLVEGPSSATIRVENPGGVTVSMTCTSPSLPLKFSMEIPASFSKASSDVVVQFEVNDPAQVQAKIDTLLPKKRVRFYKNPEDFSQGLKTEFLSTRFVAYRSSESTAAIDLYKTELSRAFNGQDLFRILKEAVIPITIVADFTPMEVQDPDLLGRTTVTSASSTASVRQFDIQYCGVNQ